jgi:hypothetical protein
MAQAKPRLGRNVFILGAGASVHAGPPLLAEFIRRARSLLMDRTRQLLYKQPIERVLLWIDQLRASAYYVDFDVDNLEHVFSLAQMGKEAGVNGTEQVYDDLTLLILETIDQSCGLKIQERHLEPDPIYSQFLGWIAKFAGADANPPQGEPDPIITFNYDVLLDNAILSHHGRPNYGLGDEPLAKTWPLYKLHGSLNWARHIGCEHWGSRELEVLHAQPIPPGRHLSPWAEAGKLPFKMATHVMYETECPACKQKHVLRPVVMPPTWSKSPSSAGIGRVWRHAIDAIGTATQLVIVGYSLPDTDTFFSYLMALGLKSNPGLRRVVVVNRDNSGDTEGRYRRAFARPLSERACLVYMPMEFREFAQREHLEAVTRIADLPA